MGKRLIQDSIVNDKLDIVGGGLTGDLFASASLLTEAKKPTVIMLSSTSAVTDKSPYFVRTSCTLAQSSAIMADWAMKSGIKRVVTVVSDFSPGHEAEAIFKDPRPQCILPCTPSPLCPSLSRPAGARLTGREHDLIRPRTAGGRAERSSARV